MTTKRSHPRPGHGPGHKKGRSWTSWARKVHMCTKTTARAEKHKWQENQLHSSRHLEHASKHHPNSGAQKGSNQAATVQQTPTRNSCPSRPEGVKRHSGQNPVRSTKSAKTGRGTTPAAKQQGQPICPQDPSGTGCAIAGDMPQHPEDNMQQKGIGGSSTTP